MPTLAKATFEPRKRPVQARSAASVDAILDATLQVLVAVGKERVTTTRVAERAGVSVGTLYQYFPNKGALLQATLKRHLEAVAEAVETACRDAAGKPLDTMVRAVVEAFLAAKMMHTRSSAGMYAVSSDVDGAGVRKLVNARVNRALVLMFESSSERMSKDAALVATMLQATMAGVSQRLLEAPHPEKQLPAIREELIAVACAYVEQRRAV